MLVTVQRIVLGLPINMLLTILSAYPLSKPSLKKHLHNILFYRISS